ncbi:MAG: hypothetical protein BGO98_33435 [Myxococcales bacterium 68-20]|nr:MAG: hypothetical protein BGO98_33435 [Myxococcales bacterium 68-20]
MKSRTHLARVAVTAVLVFAMGCRSYFLADEPSDAGGGNAEVGAADASVTAKARRIYVYGGSPDGVTLPEEPMAHYAEILPDGLLGPWRAAPKPPTSMIWHSSAQGRDFIALLSGIARPHGGNLKIFVGSVADGAVTSFVTSPDLFPNPIHHGASLIRGDVLYVMGGQIGDDKPPTADVWRSAITATTFAPPVRVTPLPAPVARMAMAEGAGSVFLVGGTDQNNANTTSILRARFQVDGSLSTFEAQTPLPSGRRYLAAAVHRSSLLVVGGQAVEEIDNVLTCPIDASGNVAPCVETTALPEPRSRHRAVIHDGRLYVVGGRTKSGGKDVLVGDLNDEGGIVGWRNTSPLPTSAIYTTLLLL